jgi:Holliday junction resolvasome RuvABC endonuclease subunit
MIYDIVKPPDAKRVMGADVSTQSFAFSIFDDGVLVQFGEIEFYGNTVFERLADGQNKVRALKDKLQVDYVAIESAVFVQNKKTVVLLAYSFGAIIAAMIDSGARVVEVAPMTWQNYIGNKVLTKAEKDAIIKETPGKSKSWYSNANRNFRKARTAKWVEDKFGYEITNDNVTDAIALGWVAATKEGILE